MGRKSGLRMVNSSRWAKHATVMITKELEAIAENTGVNVRLVIADKLKQTYIDNLTASYGPRSLQGIATAETYKSKSSTYTNTHTLETAVDVAIKDNIVKIIIDKDKTYGGDRNVPATKVIKWLNEGTEGGSRKGGSGYYKDENDEWHYNYPTRPHLFEEHTINDMKGFLDSLESDIDNGKYTTYRYTGKKKTRTHYKGKKVRKRG